jgi:hypothetical protein
VEIKGKWMLISHSKKFIFLKTIKTAGTTVEIFFEELCRPYGMKYVEGSAGTSAVVSMEGIVGARGESVKNEKYYNHQTAKEIREEFGADIWNDYFKFSIVRNPYDELISRFWFLLDQKTRISLLDAGFEATKREFKKWVMGQENLNSRIYLIDDQLAVDFLIRFEFLEDDVANVCSHLGVRKKVSELQKFKSGIRPSEGIWSRISDYYDSDSITYIENRFSWELKRFNYSIDSASSR